jgi:hypothetical protein
MVSLSLSYGAIRKITTKGAASRNKGPRILKKQKTLDAKWIEVTPHIQNVVKSRFTAIEFSRPDGFKMTVSDQQLARDFAGLFIGGLS